jgi:hypothetical protein
MHRGPVPGEPDVADFAGVAGFDGGPDAALVKQPLGVDRPIDFVELPEVQIVGLQPPQAVFQMLLGAPVVAVAALGHEKHLLPAAAVGQCLAHHLFAAPVVIIPSVIKEGHPFVDGFVHDPDRLGFLGQADMVAADSHDRDLFVGTPQPSRRNAGPVVLLHTERFAPESARRQCGHGGLQKIATIQSSRLNVVAHGLAPT